MEGNMEYEVTFKVRMEPDQFVLELDQTDREDLVKDEVLGVLYDLEDGIIEFMMVTEIDG
jgi:hypothetical protein|tara:strand:+ start:489 stop:668 length:180 start_codon:yes stop_codon:yes gene_type:complete